MNLIGGDCVEVMLGMSPGCMDLVVTSPPYNLGIGYNTFKDTAPRDEFLSWCRQWAAEVRRLMADDGSFFLNIGAAPANPLLPHQLVLSLTEGENPLFVLQNTIHWIKSITVNTRTGEPISAGHFKPINSKRYVNDCHEYVFHLTKAGNIPLDRRGAGVPYQDKSNITRWGHTGGDDMRCRGNTWFVPYDTINSRGKERPHPATFPVGLVEQCIRLHGKGVNTRMLDPFLGIGTSAIAASRQGIAAFTGIELDADYLQIARDRLEVESGSISTTIENT
jgi:site-specific DNA-methyltransferase (adenine-specific)